jgi:hypothetical protein
VGEVPARLVAEGTSPAFVRPTHGLLCIREHIAEVMAHSEAPVEPAHLHEVLIAAWLSCHKARPDALKSLTGTSWIRFLATRSNPRER